MKVYQVWSFDSYASNWGAYEPGETYRLKEKADAVAQDINDRIDKGYKDRGQEKPQYGLNPAYVKEIDVLE